MTSLKPITLLCSFFSLSLFALNPDEHVVRLIFMGKTGAGKSTLVNAFFNLLVDDISWDTFPKRFPIPTLFQECNVLEYAARHAENHSRGQLDAVTQIPSSYTAESGQQAVTMVDCPGVADPKGVYRDRDIAVDTAQFLADNPEFNAICVVLPGTINRATIQEKYAIEQIKALIPKRALARVFIILTHTRVVSENAKRFISSFGLPTENVFAFDNISLSREGHIDFARSRDDELAEEVKLAWRRAKNEYSRLITAAKLLGKYSSDEYASIYSVLRLAKEKIALWLEDQKVLDECASLLPTAEAELQRAIDACARAKEATVHAESLFIQAKSKYSAWDNRRFTPSGKLNYALLDDSYNEHLHRLCCAVEAQIEEIRLRDLVLIDCDSLRKEMDSSVCRIKSRQSNITSSKSRLIFNIKRLNHELSELCLASLNVHARDYLDVFIHREENAILREQLRREKQLFIESAAP